MPSPRAAIHRVTIMQKPNEADNSPTPTATPTLVALLKSNLGLIYPDRWSFEMLMAANHPRLPKGAAWGQTAHIRSLVVLIAVHHSAHPLQLSLTVRECTHHSNTSRHLRHLHVTEWAGMSWLATNICIVCGLLTDDYDDLSPRLYSHY